MSFIPASGILYANENFDAENETVMTAEDAIAPDESDTLAAAVSEINTDEAAINQGEEQIDSAETAVDGLETIADKVEEANENGGIDENTAEIVEAAVESILKTARIGITTKKMGLPSTESFRVKNNRVALGKASVGGIRETANKIWQAIVEAVKKSIAFVKEFFRKLFNAAERLIKRADALSEKARSLGNKKAKESKFKNSSLYASLAVDTKLASIDDVSKGGDVIKQVVEAHDAVVKQIVEGLEKDDKGVANVFFTIPGVFKEAPENVKKQVDASGDVKVFYSGVLPGNVTLFMTQATADTTPDSAIRAGKVKLSAKLEGKEELQVLSVDEIIEASTVAKGIATTVNEFRKNLSEAEKNKNKAISVMEKAANESEDGEAKAKTLAKAKVLRRLINEPTVSAGAIGVSLSKSTLEYGELSARQYTESV